MSKPIVVIGAGIVGLSSAIWLARSGLPVTVLDRAPVGSSNAASYGNAGVLAACSVAPVTAPGLVLKGPKLLLDPQFPLFLRWSYLPKLAPWLIKYLSHANDRDTKRIATGLAPLIYDSVDQHQALTQGTAANDWLTTSDYAFAYKNRAAFDADTYVWKLRQDAGFVPEMVEGTEVQEREPNLSSAYSCLAVMKDHGFVKNPAGYLKALAQEAVVLGVDIRQEEVVDFEMVDQKVSAVVSKTQRHDCSFVILASGVWSKELANKLGISVPMESERGYHLHIQNPGVAPNIPLMITTGKFVATPMEDGLRCAGVVEFGGTESGPSKGPIALLKAKVREAFPEVQLDDVTEWLGHRPAPTDSLPFIGEIRNSGVYAGFGHHHIGLTAGPKTGRILAGLIAGNKENVDLTAYRPERFAS